MDTIFRDSPRTGKELRSGGLSRFSSEGPSLGIDSGGNVGRGESVCSDRAGGSRHRQLVYTDRFNLINFNVTFESRSPCGRTSRVVGVH